MASGADTLPDPRAILTAIGLTGVTDIAAITDGEDTAIWRVTHQGMLSALRLMRAEQAGAAAREVAAVRAAAAGGVPVPAIRHEAVWQGRPVFLLEWLPGYPAATVLSVRPWRAEALGLRFGRAQAHIHMVTAPDVVRAQPDRWLTVVETEEPALCARLRALSPRADALLHLDYHPFNVIIGDGRPFDAERGIPGGTHVMGVIDWTNARGGDPRADIAYTMTILRMVRGVTGLPARTEHAAMNAFVRGWQRGYHAMRGPLGDLAPFYAWAGAFIARDVAPRLGRPGSIVTAAYLARLHRWTATWKRRAGVY